MIAALVLAAGKSERMGRPKMTLPWGESTVLGTVLRVLASAGIEDIQVVTGAARDVVEEICTQEGIQTVFNSNLRQADMLSSIQTGLESLPPGVEAALIVLGDQPQIQPGTVRRVVQAYEASRGPLVVPSYKMRRGHPWLIDRQLWPELLRTETSETAHEFLIRHASQIQHVDIDSPTILEDLDTPDDYLKLRP